MMMMMMIMMMIMMTMMTACLTMLLLSLQEPVSDALKVHPSTHPLYQLSGFRLYQRKPLQFRPYLAVTSNYFSPRWRGERRIKVMVVVMMMMMMMMMTLTMMMSREKWSCTVKMETGVNSSSLPPRLHAGFGPLLQQQLIIVYMMSERGMRAGVRAECHPHPRRVAGGATGRHPERHSL
jgi:hypothetical protein